MSPPDGYSPEDIKRRQEEKDKKRIEENIQFPVLMYSVCQLCDASWSRYANNVNDYITYRDEDKIHCEIDKKNDCKGHVTYAEEETKRKNKDRFKEDLRKEWNVSFDDLKGLDDEIEYLKSIEENILVAVKKDYRIKKIKINKGVILMGPPGVAKTPLIRAWILDCMKRNTVGFFWANLEDVIIGNDVGKNLMKINSVFNIVRKNAVYNTLYFLVMDDFEYALKDRMKGTGANQTAIATAIMKQLDDLPDNVIKVAASNIPIMDDAIIKRIGHIIQINFPNAIARKDILLENIKYLNTLGSLSDENINKIVELTELYTGNGISKMCGEITVKMDRTNNGFDPMTLFLEHIDSGLYKTENLDNRWSRYINDEPCPHCGHKDIIKWGGDRLRCKQCKKTFTKEITKNKINKKENVEILSFNYPSDLDMLKLCLAHCDKRFREDYFEMQKRLNIYGSLDNSRKDRLKSGYRYIKEKLDIKNKMNSQHQQGFDKNGDTIKRE